MLHLVGQARRDAHGLVEGCVQILDDDRVLDSRARALVGCHPVEVAFSDAATEQQHGAGVGEMPVHAVVNQLVDGVRHLDLVPHLVARLALDEHVPAELAGEHDQRAVKQPALLEVEHELRDRGVDLTLQVGKSLVAVLVRIPVQEWHVLSGQLDEARTGLDEPPRKQTATPELTCVVRVEHFFFLERQVERLGRRRGQEPVRVVE